MKQITDKSVQIDNGNWESTQFNSRLQPTQIALRTTQNNTDLLKLDYTYGTTNNNGNVLTQKITVPNGFTADQTYTYDSLNRLKSATETISGSTSWRQTFDYDRYGNRRFDTSSDANGNKTTTLESGCAVAVCNPTIDPATNKLIGYTFDNAGNTEIDANGRQFTYDAENKQILVEDSSNNKIGEYFYDGDGKRVKKIEYANNQPVETTIFIYDASGKMVAEYSTNVETVQPRVSYLTNDHLGSPRITTDKDGDVFSRRDFMPFGEEITSGHTSQRVVGLNYGEDGIKQKFTSYERDIESELDFAEARYYKSQHGRFTSPDPLGNSAVLEIPQSINRYAYVINNPLMFIDPTGLIWVQAAGCSGGDCQPTWIDDDKWNNYSDEQKKPFEVVKNLTYNSVTGNQVILDPNGPSEENPSGWKFGGPNTEDAYLGVAVGGIAIRGLATAGGAAVVDGPIPIGDLVGVVIVVGTAGTVIYTVATHEGPHSLPFVDPNIYAKGGRKYIRNHWNDAAVGAVGNDVAKQIAWLKDQYKKNKRWC